MATLVLSAVGSAIGGAIGGSAFGISSVAAGRAIGAAIGGLIDASLLAPHVPDQVGPVLDDLSPTSSTEGTTIPRLWGSLKLPGSCFWSTDFLASTNTVDYGKGVPSQTTTTYTMSFALGLCEGPIRGIGRIWVEGAQIKDGDYTYRVYLGDETQTADPLIEAAMGGSGTTPAYRGLAYIVFDTMNVTAFGNRRPRIEVEVFAGARDGTGAIEADLQAITMLPGTGEFALGTSEVRSGPDGSTVTENVHATPGLTDAVVALDRLEAMYPNVTSIGVIVGFFGDDLRAGNCTVKPGVESATKTTTPYDWEIPAVLSVYTRSNAHLVTTLGSGDLAYGGTPSAKALAELLVELNSRGMTATIYPFLMMDIPEGNALPDPYSDNAATTGQPAYPWRGRITCSPAPGYVGTVDKTAAAKTQIDAFFGTTSVTDAGSLNFQEKYRDFLFLLIWSVALSDDFATTSATIDSILLGSELRGLTQVRDDTGAFPAVDQLVSLASDVAALWAIMFPTVPVPNIGYAADWTEYFGYQPDDGSGDVLFNLDPLWSDSNINFIGIDAYFPLSDWRDGDTHLDAVAGAPNIYDADYLSGNIEGGEGYDWYYASAADRDAQTRTAITDSAYSKPWVFRPKDFRNWWMNSHYDRHGGVESGTATAWVPQSKPIRFTEFGCPAIDRGSNQPNVFVDAKSSESAEPYYSRGWRDENIQRAFIETVLGYWSDAANNPDSTAYSAPMVDLTRSSAYSWDARPYPQFPGLTDVWGDYANWETGHWLTGAAASAPVGKIISQVAVAAGWPSADVDVTGVSGRVDGYVVSSIQSPRDTIQSLASLMQITIVESGVTLIASDRAGVTATMDTFAVGDLVRTDDAPYEIARGQESELPEQYRITAINPAIDFETYTADARRAVVREADGVAASSVNVAMSPSETIRHARIALAELWTGIDTITAALPPSSMALDPGDLVTIDGGVYRLKSVSVGGDGGAEAIAADPSIYDIPPGPSQEGGLSPITTFGAPVARFIDTPLLTDSDPAWRPRIAANSRPWPEQMGIWKSSTTSNWTQVDTITQPAIAGTLDVDFPSGPSNRWDNGNELQVTLLNGTLESGGDEAALDGSALIAVQQSDGRWELIGYATATLIGTNQYKLTRLLRGQRGTEAMIGDPALSGAAVVVLDANAPLVATDESDIGIEWNWRVGPLTEGATGDNAVPIVYTPAGRGLVPFSPDHISAELDTATNNITIKWKRRDRAIAADIWDRVSIPLSDDFSFDLELLNLTGTTVKRTVSNISSLSYTYTAAVQTIDFGAPISFVRARVYQLGAYGRGDPGEELILRMAQT